MPKRCNIRILAALLLLLSMLVPKPAGAWYCEGQQCGTAFGACCCISAPDSRDLSCSQSAASQGKAAVCQGGCSCVMVLHAATPPAAAASAAPAAAPVVFLPVPVAVFVAPPVTEQVVTLVPARGPPCQAISFTVPSLRAPPAA